MSANASPASNSVELDYFKLSQMERVKARKKGMKERPKKGETVSWANFDILALLGHGAFGKVWKVRKKDDGCIYAMKTMRKGEIVDQDLVAHTLLEKDIMGLLGYHPFIVDLHYAFQTEEKLHLVMDILPGGSLFDRLSTAPEPFPESTARFYGAETLLAIEALHDADIVYRDLKLENMLLDAQGHVRATDFGLAAKVKKGQKVKSFSGTAMYLAPEMLSKKGHSKSVDVWAYGVMLHIMLTQEPPFWSENRNEMFELIRSAEPPLDSEFLSPEAKSLLKGLLAKDIRVRLGCGERGWAEVKEHPFFASVNWDDVLAKKVKPPIIPKEEEDFAEGEAFLESIADEDRIGGKGVDATQLFKDFDFVSVEHRKFEQTRKESTMTEVKAAIIFMKAIKIQSKLNGKLFMVRWQFADKSEKVYSTGETIKSVSSQEQVPFSVDNAIEVEFTYPNAPPPPKDQFTLSIQLVKVDTGKKERKGEYSSASLKDAYARTTINLLDYCTANGEHTQAFDLMKGNKRLGIVVTHFQIELKQVPLSKSRKSGCRKIDASRTQSTAAPLFASAPPTSPRPAPSTPRGGKAISSDDTSSPAPLTSFTLPPPVFFSKSKEAPDSSESTSASEKPILSRVVSDSKIGAVSKTESGSGHSTQWRPDIGEIPVNIRPPTVPIEDLLRQRKNTATRAAAEEVAASMTFPDTVRGERRCVSAGPQVAKGAIAPKDSLTPPSPSSGSSSSTSQDHADAMKGKSPSPRAGMFKMLSFEKKGRVEKQADSDSSLGSASAPSSPVADRPARNAHTIAVRPNRRAGSGSASGRSDKRKSVQDLAKLFNPEDKG